jgi:hypothetical protein
MPGACRAMKATLYLGLVSLAVSGCSTDRRVGAEGDVTIDGQPVVEGAIHFEPTEKSTANTSGAKIIKGHYEILPSHGLKPGEYRVTVQAYIPTGRKIQDPQFGLVDELVPAQLLENGKLTTTIKPGDANQLNFSFTQSAM